tara:strand:+ start:413 stop:4840 length:4428 start_codon:yes stop_codon:yes gene_type:complete
MPELKRIFTSGKMNKDLDERLVPNGQYTDALNIRVSDSEGSNVGAIESVLGNTKKNKKSSSANWNANFGFTSAKCIGSIKDSQNNKIYWFVTSSSVDAILEYEESTGFVSPILVDTGSILNFNTSNFITGVNIFEGILAWTDNLNEPCKIDISLFKTGSTQTGLDIDTTTQVYGRALKAADVTVIRKSPKAKISIEIDSTLVTVNNGKMGGLNALTLEPVNFNLGGTGLYPKSGDVAITFAQGGGIGPLSSLENKKVRIWGYYEDEFGYNKKYEIEGTLKTGTFVSSGEVAGNYVGADFTIQTIPLDVPNSLISWKIQLVESDYIYKREFPRFSYRWKYKNGEYSTMAPFSRPAFLPGFYRFDPGTGINEGMSNHARKITLTLPTNATYGPGDDVEYVEILYKSSESNNIYVIKTHDRGVSNIPTFEITSELTGPVVESNQIIRLFDDVPRKALCQEVIGNRLVYANYLRNQDVDPDVTLAVAHDTAVQPTTSNGNASVKSNRTYQLGVSFLDEYNRESPVFTDENSSLLIDATHCDTVNKIKVNVTSAAPSWASFYKYYIKEISSTHENLVLDRVYDDGDGSVWLSFPSSERNKVSVGEFLSLKKKHDIEEAVKSLNEYKILDIQNEAPFYIVNKPVHKISTLGTTTGGNEFSLTSSEQKFYGPPHNSTNQNPGFDDAIKQGNFIQFRLGLLRSARYEILSGGVSSNIETNIAALGAFSKYAVKLKNPTGILNDDDWLTDATLMHQAALEINVFAIERNYKAEYQGKFFVKVSESNEITQYVKDASEDVSYAKLYRTKLSDTIPSSPLSTILTGVQSTWFGTTVAVTESVKRSRMAFTDTNRTSQTSPTTNGQHPTNGQKNFDIIYGPYNIEGVRQFSEDAGKVYDKLISGTKIRFDESGDKGSIYTIITATLGTYVRGGDTYKTAAITVDRNFDESFTNGDVNGFSIMIEKEDLAGFTSKSPAVFETIPKKDVDLDIYYEATGARQISNFGTEITLQYYNCVTFGNGVESQSSLDDFNTQKLGKGVRVSSVLKEPYVEERRKSGLIYGGLFNGISSFNELNQFIAGIKSTKDLNPIYGGIQKLHARDTDLIALAEDKCFRILANKDALFNADGNPNITSSNSVLGQSVPYLGEFGISKNPETFASYGFRCYFTDKSRGTVIRLSRDGITEIANKGMADFMEDKFKSHSGDIIGSYDEAGSGYNLSFSGDESISYKEGVDGWTSRLSFAPEAAVSLNNEYYTIKDGELWQHSNATVSNFYGTQYSTSVKLIHNDEASSIKNFKTLSYEGDEGWTATVNTNDQDGEVVTWKNKEGIFYNYIRGAVDSWNNSTQTGSIDTSEFSVQGIDVLDILGTTSPIMQLQFNNKINVSLQEASDDLVFYQKLTGIAAGNIYKIGTCSDITGNQVSVNNTESIAYDDAGDVTSIQDGDFVFFVKNSQINTSGLIGYYASVEMTNATGNNKELFAVNSEIFVSS